MICQTVFLYTHAGVAALKKYQASDGKEIEMRLI